jgi:hypothetical protein
MLLNIFRFSDHASRSAMHIELVCSVGVTNIPPNQDLFARQYGGDFCELETDPEDDLLVHLKAYAEN